MNKQGDAHRTYVIDESELEFTISTSGKGCAQAQEIQDFVNVRFTGSVQLMKVSDDDSAAPLSGAQFELYAIAGNGEREKIAEVTTDKTGTAVAEGLEAGQYEFIETVAPDGYAITEEALPFEIVYDEHGQQQILIVEAKNAKLPEPTPSPTPDATEEPEPTEAPKPDATEPGANPPDDGNGLPQTGGHRLLAHGSRCWRQGCWRSSSRWC